MRKRRMRAGLRDTSMGLFDETTDMETGGGARGTERTSEAAGMSSFVLSVTDLTKCIRGVLEAEDLFRDVWVRGEISNLTKHGSGHIYFSLKDAGALIRCVIWNSAARSAKFDLREGMGIIARGRLTVYEKQGQYQLTVNEVTPDGIGALYVELERLKAKLDAEGLFDSARKKPIPPFPRKIAIITSPSAAALRDMVTIARRRMPSVDLLLVPTLMQGADSVQSIVESLRIADTATGADVIVLGRGGGSPEDLWSFNAEAVARAIFACGTPVVSAIGHETDFTLADFVADLRAPTPSAAMELILPDRAEVGGRLQAIVDSMASSVQSMVAQRRAGLELMLSSPSLKYPERMLQTRWQGVDALEERLTSTFRLMTSQRAAQLGEATARLDSLSPLAVLSRGYGIVRQVDSGTVIKSVMDARAGDTVEILVSDGRLISDITKVEEGWS